MWEATTTYWRLYRLKLKLERNPREMKSRTRLDTQKLADKEMLVTNTTLRSGTDFKP